jgi:hypothetical protein
MTFQFFCSECDPKCERPLKTVTFQDYAAICHHTNSADYTFLEYVIKQLDGKCPVCGHKLKVPPVEVKVRSKRFVEVSKQ